MTITIETGRTKMSGEATRDTFTGTREELLAIADKIDKSAARRGWSGVVDRATAAEIRHLVNAVVA